MLPNPTQPITCLPLFSFVAPTFARLLPRWGSAGGMLVLWLGICGVWCSGCIFNNDTVQVNVVSRDTVGLASGVLLLGSPNGLSLTDPNGSYFHTYAATGLTNSAVLLDPQRLQGIYIADAAPHYPEVVSFSPNIHAPMLHSIDYAAPLSFGYANRDTLYFLCRSNRFISTIPTYTAAIQSRINLLCASADTLLGLAISAHSDLALVVKVANASANPYRVVWQTRAGTIKTYVASFVPSHLFWLQGGGLLGFASEKGIFTWSAAAALPKTVAFAVGIRSFAFNPIGTEIGYTKGTDTLFILHLNAPKYNRAIRTPAPVVAIDWQ